MRKIAFAIFVVAVLPIYLGMRLCMLIFGGDRAFGSVSQFFAFFPGVVGLFARKAYYFLALEKFSPSAGVGFGSYISHPTTRVGPEFSCGAYCILGTCDIGEDVHIGAGVHILSGKRHHVFDENGHLVRGALERIRIGDHTWIGAGSVIMASLGDGCVVGAGAVVTKEVEDNCLVAGNPARMIRKVNQEPTGR